MIKKAEKQKKEDENSPKNKIPDIWIANVTNYDTKNLVDIFDYATSIFVKNGITKRLKFNFVDVNEAKKHYGTYPYQMFLAIRNDNIPSDPGHSTIGPGEIGVYDEAGWQSYINLAHNVYLSHGNSTYAQGYGLAHEILHQMLGLASYARGEGASFFSHDNSIENLNMDGSNVQIPLGLSPPGTIYQAEKILQYQLNYLTETYETNQ